jgi:hypothetical protein
MLGIIVNRPRSRVQQSREAACKAAVQVLGWGSSNVTSLSVLSPFKNAGTTRMPEERGAMHTSRVERGLPHGRSFQKQQGEAVTGTLSGDLRSLEFEYENLVRDSGI